MLWGDGPIDAIAVREADAGRIVLLRTQWLGPHRNHQRCVRETDPRTIIITVDDDLDYPSTLIEHLAAAIKRPDAAIGMKGMAPIGPVKRGRPWTGTRQGERDCSSP